MISELCIRCYWAKDNVDTLLFKYPLRTTDWQILIGKLQDKMNFWLFQLSLLRDTGERSF